jgi:hypothetical protein
MSVRLLVVVVLATGCAQRACPDGSAQSIEVADGNHLTGFQIRRLIGHYTTLDGRSGFILDRFADPPRARLDGDPTVRTLSRRGSVRGAYELISEDKTIWLRIDEETGDVLLFQGPQQRQGVRVQRDADASGLTSEPISAGRRG